MDNNIPRDDKQSNPEDAYASLRGQKDDQGIPLHPEERAEYYRVKFQESSKGANELLSANKKLKEENESLQKKKENYTNSRMSELVPDWDMLTLDQQKSIVSQMGALQNDLEQVKAQVAEIIDERAFEQSFKQLTADDKYAILKKHKSAFKQYAYEDENLNSPLKVLANSFMVTNSLFSAPEPKDNNPDAGLSGLDSGSGGSRIEPKKAGYTIAEAEEIRTRDPRKYNRLIREGKMIIKE